MRGGAYKPRTSPHEFQGLGLDGLKMLNYIREKYKLCVVSEILDTNREKSMAKSKIKTRKDQPLSAVK